jgi:hypothetical protein
LSSRTAVAGAALIARVAHAVARLAVAGASVGALGVAVSSVVEEGDIDPSAGEGAGAQGAVGPNPRGHNVVLRIRGAVLPLEARAAGWGSHPTKYMTTQHLTVPTK